MKKQLTWAGAEQRAIQIQGFRSCGYTHQAIADMLKIHVSTVTKYLSSRCKAAIRAGVASIILSLYVLGDRHPKQLIVWMPVQPVSKADLLHVHFP